MGSRAVKSARKSLARSLTNSRSTFWDTAALLHRAAMLASSGVQESPFKGLRGAVDQVQVRLAADSGEHDQHHEWQTLGNICSVIKAYTDQRIDKWKMIRHMGEYFADLEQGTSRRGTVWGIQL